MRNQFSEIFLSKGVNYFKGDMPLQNALQFLGFKSDKEINELGLFISEKVIESADIIDHSAKPKLQTWSILGKRIDYVRISPDHENILKKLLELGSVSKSASGKFSWLYHFVSGYLISDSGLFCTLTLTAQTAYALSKYGNDELREQYFSRYIDREEPWLGATFYSETQGGSDLGNNNTTATLMDNKWAINGSDKYFASNAGLADGSLVTAKIKDGYGVKNIALFFVPAYLEDQTQNYQIRRLKDKLGTTAVPTGEVEFHDSVGYLIGDINHGIYYAMEVLTISRIDNAVAACGIARKALWEAFLYSNERSAFGKKIIEHPLLKRDFIELESELEGSTFLSLFAAKKFSEACNETPPYSDEYNLARLLSHIAKNMAAETSTAITRYSMEIFGGIGFFEEFPAAKFHRDALVTSIWEGTSNIQALDMLEVIVRKKAHKKLLESLKQQTESIQHKETREKLILAVDNLGKELDDILSRENYEIYAKDILRNIGIVTSSVLMYGISYSTTNPDDRKSLLNEADLYYLRNIMKNEEVPVGLITNKGAINWMGRPKK
ncbi:MAG: acyl-CoA dehydrogenase family protein [Thermoplasmataceae archaeon]